MPTALTKITSTKDNHIDSNNNLNSKSNLNNADINLKIIFLIDCVSFFVFEFGLFCFRFYLCKMIDCFYQFVMNTHTYNLFNYSSDKSIGIYAKIKTLKR